MDGMQESTAWSPPARPAKVSLDAQIVELMREVEQRKRVYPRFVVDGRMEAAKAEHRIAALEQSIKNLRALRALEEERRK